MEFPTVNSFLLCVGLDFFFDGMRPGQYNVFSSRETAYQQVGWEAIHIACQTETLECPNEVAGDIQLPPVEAGKGRAWEGMMIVVPALAETQKRHNPLIAALISRLELALAKNVADGIGAKCDMMHQKNSYQPSPKESGPSTNHEGEHEREQYPESVSAIDQDDDRVLQEMTAVHAGIRYPVFEEPAYIRVKKTFKRTMWITLTISACMMFDVDGCPFKHRTFHGHGAENE